MSRGLFGLSMEIKKGQGALNEIAAPFQPVSKQPLFRVAEPENDGMRKPEDGGSTTRPKAKPMTVLQPILV